MIGTDAERWTARARALAEVLAVDAVAVLLPVDERFVAYAAHGVSDDAALAPVAALLASAATAPATSAHAGVALTDGRLADHLLAVPIRLEDRALGVFAALDARHAFGEIHAARVQRAADIVAIELAASNALFHAERAERELERRLGQAEDDRAQALLLYELGRLFAGDRALELAAAMLAEAGHHAVVGIWAIEGGTSLELRASRGHPPGVQQMVLGDASSGPAAAIRARAPQVASFAPGALRPAWAPEGASAFLIAPIRDDVRDAGLLVLGRDGPHYTEAESEFASLLAFALLPLLPPAPPAGALETAPPGAAEPVRLPPPDAPAASAVAAAPGAPPAPRAAIAGALLAVALAEALLADAVLATAGPAGSDPLQLSTAWSPYPLLVLALGFALALLRAPSSATAARWLFAVTLISFVARGFAVLLEPGAAPVLLGLRVAEGALALAAAAVLTGRLRAANLRVG